MMKHNYYNQCEYCGAALDPGETCDCQSQDQTYLDLGSLDLTELNENLRKVDTDIFFDLLMENFSVG